MLTTISIACGLLVVCVKFGFFIAFHHLYWSVLCDLCFCFKSPFVFYFYGGVCENARRCIELDKNRKRSDSLITNLLFFIQIPDCV